MQKQTRKIITSPAGIIKFSHINKPNTKFNAEGEFSVDLLLDPAEPGVQEFKDKLVEAAAAARKQFIEEEKNPAKKKKIEAFKLCTCLKEDEDEDGNVTGLTVLKTKNKALIKKKNGETLNKTIKVYDAKGKAVQNLNIGRGSKVKVAFIINPFCMPATNSVGITLWLEAVQVIDLVAYGSGQDAQDFGFGEEEGYESEGEEQTEETTEVGTDAEAPAEAF